MIFAIPYIDFEDGINLGLVSEDFALEYLIKLVKTVLTHQNIKRLQPKRTASVICALAIGSLISDAVKVFIDNEEAILKGKFLCFNGQKQIQSADG
jgi:dGTPase